MDNIPQWPDENWPQTTEERVLDANLHRAVLPLDTCAGLGSGLLVIVNYIHLALTPLSL